MRNRNGVDDISSVPTLAMRGGDFSSLLGNTVPTVIYYPGTNTPFAGNIIAPSLISPAATALLKYFPQPTGTGLRNNYQLIASNPNNNNNFNLQVSDPITTKDRSTSIFHVRAGNPTISSPTISKIRLTDGVETSPFLIRKRCNRPWSTP